MDFRQLDKKPGALWDAPKPQSAAPAKAVTPPPMPMRGMLPTSAGGDEALTPEQIAQRDDRKKTQQELSGMFSIVADDFEGQRLPNQVTQAEYEQLCNNFSDIRTGNSQINMSGKLLRGEEDTGAPKDPELLQQRTLDDIAFMLQTAGGRDLIQQLATAKDKDGKAITTTIDWCEDPTDAATDATDREQRDRRSSGEGTDMTVRYAPNKPVTAGDPQADPAFQGVRSDVLLFHELVHALHGSKGEMQRFPVKEGELAPNDPVGISMEEYATTGLGRYEGPESRLTENAYRAERRALAGTSGEHRGDDGPGMQHRPSYIPSTGRLPFSGLTRAEEDEEKKRP